MPCPFKRILLATEGTEFDTGAEQVSIALAASCGVPLMGVLPLVSNTEFETMAPELEEQAEAESAAKIQKIRQTAHAQRVEFLGNVRLGEAPYREIVNEAQEKRAELIVVRRRGKRSFLANLFLGEMVHSVTGNAPCDVLIVPRSAPVWSRGILLATDYSPQSKRATEIAAAMANHYGLPVTVVTVVEHGDGKEANEASAHVNLEQTLAVIRAAGAQARGRIYADGKPAKVILQALEENGADLIVIGRRGINRVERILVGSTSEWVASHASCPVLIIRQNPPSAT